MNSTVGSMASRDQSSTHRKSAYLMFLHRATLYLSSGLPL
jgi:hypothetical protein